MGRDLTSEKETLFFMLALRPGSVSENSRRVFGHEKYFSSSYLVD